MSYNTEASMSAQSNQSNMSILFSSINMKILGRKKKNKENDRWATDAISYNTAVKALLQKISASFITSTSTFYYTDTLACHRQVYTCCRKS